VALAARSGQLAQLVDASSTVFSAFGSEEQSISRALVDLPGTLTQATTTLGQVQTFADQLGPTAQSLQPAAQALPAANEALASFAKPATPIVQNQIRPFVVAAKPVVGNLSPAATNLANATPNLQKSFVVLNHLVNMLGYSPSGGQHGYLFWLAWLGHNTRTLFSIQDANGPYRPLFIQFSCSQIAQLTNAGSPFSLVGGLLNLVPLRKFCPGLGALRARPSHGALSPSPAAASPPSPKTSAN
jgi:phospholipid/cholesterol/gamma-HCH transport system substrate-binding protein